MMSDPIGNRTDLAASRQSPTVPSGTLLQRHNRFFRLDEQNVKQPDRLLDFFPVHEPGDPE